MEKLEREAAVTIAQLDGLLHDLAVGLAGQNNPGVKGIEKTDEQRSIVVYQEPSGNAHRWPRARILLEVSKEQLLPFIEERLSSGMTSYSVILVAAAAVVASLLARHLHPRDGAVIVAPFTHKRGELAFPVHNLLKPLEPRSLAGHSLSGQKGRTYGAAHLLVLRHGQCLTFQLLMKGGDYGLVVEHGTRKDNLVAQLSVLHHLGEIVLGYGIGQAGRDCLQGHALLLCRRHCLPHKRSTSRPQINGMRGGKCQVCKLTVGHRDAQHFGQFVDEASRPRSTGFVHVIVHNNAISLDNQL